MMRSRSRSRDRRDERGRVRDRSPAHEDRDRGRSDPLPATKSFRRADHGQRDDRWDRRGDDSDRRGDGGWGGRGHGGAPLPSGGRQVQTRYAPQASQHQSRSAVMAVHQQQPYYNRQEYYNQHQYYDRHHHGQGNHQQAGYGVSAHTALFPTARIAARAHGPFTMRHMHTARGTRGPGLLSR